MTRGRHSSSEAAIGIRSRHCVVALFALCLWLLSVGTGAARAELVFKRASGPAIEFSGTPAVWCAAWEPGAARRTIHVELRGPDRGWELSAVLADVRNGRRIKFPTDILAGHPHGAMLFAYSHRPLVEASTNEEEASGWLAFSQASCGIGETVAFTVHAQLGSELAGVKGVRADGRFSGVIGAAR